MAALPPVFTVTQAMQQCGVPVAPLFGGQSPAQRVANQIFIDSFDTTLNVSIDEVDDAMTAFTKLTVANGRIPMQPGVKRRVKAFVQWSRSMLRNGRDPTLVAFPVADIISLTQDLHTCTRFEKMSDTLVAQAKPKDFTEEVEWRDWEPTLVNYLLGHWQAQIDLVSLVNAMLISALLWRGDGTLCRQHSGLHPPC